MTKTFRVKNFKSPRTCFKIMLLCIISVLPSVFAMGRVAIAGTHIIGPVSDAYLQSSVRYNNDQLKLNHKNNRVSYLRFHIDDMATQKIKRATLRLRVHRDGGNGSMSIYLGNSSIWTEKNLNKSNAPKALGAAIVRKNETYRVDHWYSFDVTSAIITNGPISFILKKDSAANDFAFGSKEAPGYAPELIIETNTWTKPKDIILTLVNAKNNRDLLELDGDDTINLQNVGKSLNIRADISNKTTLVRFDLNGTKFNNDSNAPYFFTSEHQSWTPSRGVRTIEVHAYYNNKRVAQRKVKLTVIDKKENGSTYFKKNRGDLISLHYDHMADPDDGHATVAARTVTRHWGITPHVVSGTHSFPVNRLNASPKPFQQAAMKVMRAAWGNNWLNAHNGNNEAPNAVAVEKTAKKWFHTLQKGGHVWVAEGGPSDFTAHVLKYMKNRLDYQFKQPRRIHVIQHGAKPCSNPKNFRLNEKWTVPSNLGYVQNNTDYQIIGNGNCSQKNDVFLPTANFRSTDKTFNKTFKTAAAKSINAAAWSSAFKYWDPVNSGNNEALKITDGDTITYPWAALDFSDTVELMRILGIGINKVNDCKDFLNVFIK